MITSLAIKNYALIEDIRVGFNTGLTIITGETGAGKSILLGALGLVLGKRADLKVMKDATNKCIIEAEFSIGSYHLNSLFEENDLDYESTSILRREILPSGKSRAFVNDTPVTLQQMQTLGERLIDIHSQNDTRTLITEAYQMEVIDALAGNDTLLKRYTGSLEVYKKVAVELEKLISEKEQAAKELDYHSFLYTELTQAQLQSLDQQGLEETYEKLNNTEEIQESFAQVSQLLAADNSGVLASTSQARTVLGHVQGFSSEYETLWNRLNSVIIELEDVCEEIQGVNENLDADPKLLVQVNEKLQTLYNLQQKHTVATVEELIVIEEDLASKIEDSSNIGNRIELLEYELEKKKNDVLEFANQLTVNREKAIPVLKNKLEVFLKDLGLPDAQFQFNLTEVGDGFRKNGNTTLELLFTANKGMALGSLQKVASGGEMSRIMLAVKAILTRYRKLPTLVFDEIDTGVSGEMANKMAEIMSEMSANMQVFSITHLPQIAAKGDYHKRVFKAEENNITTTQIKDLTAEERIIEIAQMIGGSSVSDSAIAHAKQLLN
ncbi:MAG: DNA repair protein RecN [Flavobacteriaceae bacterium]|nr:DNA repair protein RecN [Flavobacteriaceae bacterium]